MRLSKLFVAALLPLVGFGQTKPDENQVSRKYTIVGDVEFPGAYALAIPMRIFDAIAHAGGFRNWMQPVNDTIVVKRGDKEIKFDWMSYREGRGLEQNVFLRDGDVIVVTPPKESR